MKQEFNLKFCFNRLANVLVLKDVYFIPERITYLTLLFSSAPVFSKQVLYFPQASCQQPHSDRFDPPTLMTGMRSFTGWKASPPGTLISV